MAKKQKFYVHLSSLISQARLKNGYATLKEFYREKKPSIDYQTWLNAESGRRIPSAPVVICIAENLGIDHESVILAYCKDKFPSEKSQQAIDMLKMNKFVDIDTLLKAEGHNRSKEYVFNNLELEEMRQDIRLRLFLTYTYDDELNTTVERLACFFKESEKDVRKIVSRLADLNLVQVKGDQVKKIHKHTCVPNTLDNFSLRKKLLIESLERTVKPDSYIANYHISITEDSYKRVLAFLDIISANLIKLNANDDSEKNTSRFQFAITGNRLPRKADDKDT